MALGAASNLPDAKAVSPDILKSLETSQIAAEALDSRAEDDSRASRSNDRGTEDLADAEVSAEDIYVLPIDDYEFTSPYGVRFGKLHAGIDLAAPDGTPYKAVHAGEVTAAGYAGGYGYSITIRQADGTEMIYAHSRRLLVKKGDQVKAGQVIGEVGNTGYSYGTHLHLEVHVGGNPVDPIVFLKDNAVDIKLQIESPYAGMVAAEAAS